jgi:uncharacterized protein (DUF934 family)
MNKIVSDLGFRPLDNIIIYENWSNFSASATSIDLPPDADLSLLKGNLNKFKIIRIDFPTFADGRGFTLGKLIRIRGFIGHLRAKGHIISDQYAMLRRSGFDDVEISQELAERQPEGEWLFRSEWKEHDYQKRIGFDKFLR